jgi:hypothetical protein
MTDGSHPATAGELFERQLRLQSEAAGVIMDLKLFDLLKRAGIPKPVGSLATGLMVWRDIDFTVICDRLDVGVVTDIASSLAAHRHVRSVEFRNDSGRWNEDDSAYPDGLFLGVEHVTEQVWEVDIWFVDEPDRQPDLAHVSEFSQRLTDADREAILTIKHALAGRPGYSSHRIYRAVLDHGVTSLEEFERFADEGLPSP